MDVKSNFSNTSLECANVFNYNPSSSNCQSELLQALSDSNCEHQNGGEILITREMGQLVNQLVLGLQGLRASSVCQAEALSLVCLYAHGLCSSSGVYIIGSRSTRITCQFCLPGGGLVFSVSVCPWPL